MSEKSRLEELLKSIKSSKKTLKVTKMMSKNAAKEQQMHHLDHLDTADKLLVKPVQAATQFMRLPMHIVKCIKQKKLGQFHFCT